jgi:ArsR family transcriptional regulator
MSNIQIEDLALSEMFKALGNQHRLAIFHRLSTCCQPGTHCSVEDAGRCVGQLGEGLEIAPSTLSHHLKELHRAGLIEMKRQGKQVICWIDPQTLRRLAAFFAVSHDIRTTGENHV